MSKIREYCDALYAKNRGKVVQKPIVQKPIVQKPVVQQEPITDISSILPPHIVRLQKVANPRYVTEVNPKRNRCANQDSGHDPLDPINDGFVCGVLLW